MREWAPSKNAKAGPPTWGRTGLEFISFALRRGAQFTLTADQAAATALYWALLAP
jgi:hypothetical protein